LKNTTIIKPVKQSPPIPMSYKPKTLFQYLPSELIEDIKYLYAIEDLSIGEIARRLNLNLKIYKDRIEEHIAEASVKAYRGDSLTKICSMYKPLSLAREKLILEEKYYENLEESYTSEKGYVNRRKGEIYKDDHPDLIIRRKVERLFKTRLVPYLLEKEPALRSAKCYLLYEDYKVLLLRDPKEIREAYDELIKMSRRNANNYHIYREFKDTFDWYIQCIKQEYAWVQYFYPRPIRTVEDRAEIGQLIKDIEEFERVKDIPGFEWLLLRQEYEEYVEEGDLFNLD
jgi:hypothetical protein